jgi:hypothetical protein
MHYFVMVTCVGKKDVHKGITCGHPSRNVFVLSRIKTRVALQRKIVFATEFFSGTNYDIYEDNITYSVTLAVEQCYVPSFHCSYDAILIEAG